MNDFDPIKNVIAGLTIIAKYDSTDICAEHDAIYAGASAWEAMTDAEYEQMEENGWHWDEDAQSFRIFV